MQLIGMLDSPYVRRVAVALIVAKVPFEHRPISLFRHIDAFAKINPLLKAPTLVADNGAVLMDSGVILDYLTAAYPRVAALTPPDVTGRLRRAARDGARSDCDGKGRAASLRTRAAPAGKAARSLGRTGHGPAPGRIVGARRRGAAKRLDQGGTRRRRHHCGLRLRLRAVWSWRTSSRRAAIRVWRNFAPAPRRFPLFAPRRPKTA